MTKITALSLFLCLFFCAAPAFGQQITITNPDTINICLGDTVRLQQTNDLGNANLVWRPEDDFIDPVTSPNPRVTPSVSRYYVVTVSNASGTAADSVWVDVSRLVVPNLIADTVHCGSTPLQLVTDRVEDTGNTVYDWSPGDFLTDSTDVNSIFISAVTEDTVFTLIATAENGACADTQSVRVEIIPSELVVAGGMDTVFRCDDAGPITLSAAATPATGVMIDWRPSTGVLSDLTGNTIEVDPVNPIVYYAEAIVNGCPQIDSVAVRTDSLPDDLGFTVDPVKDPYCPGDTFTIKSPIYDVGDYPLITHDWLIAPGLASPDDLYNAVVFASDSALFTRVTVNGACMDTVREQINVVRPPMLIFDPVDPIVCPGEALQITVSFSPDGPSGTLEWMDPIGGTLSCDDCLDPVATLQATNTYMIEVDAEGSDCSSTVEYTVRVAEDAPPALTDDTQLCAGESRRLIIGGLVDDYTYRITGGGVDTDDPTVEVTPTAATTTYTIETTGECGTTSQQVTLTVAADYTVSITAPDAVCSGEEVSLTANVTNDLTGTFTWTVNNTRTLSGRTVTDRPVTASTYSVVFEDAQGCSLATAETTVNVIGDDLNPLVIATDAAGQPVSAVAAGGTVTLEVTMIPDEAGTTYEWSSNPSFEPATGNGRTLQVTVPRGQSAPTSATYTVTITTPEGCVFVRTITLGVLAANFEFPELITPNGDGTNDVFRIFATPGVPVTDYNLIVFNRWGQKVFTSTDAALGWDGTKNGTPQNQDTYLYLASFRINGVDETKEGQFSLIR